MIWRRSSRLAQLTGPRDPYRLAFEASREAVVVVDGDSLAIVDANPAAESMYRRTRDDLVEMTIADLTPEADLAAASVRRAVEAGRHAEERTHLRSDGSSFPARIGYMSEASDDWTIVVATVRDLSEQDARGDERFRLLSARSFDVTTVFDARGICTYASDSVLRVFGERPETLVGQSGWEWIHPEDRARVEELLAAQLRNEWRTPIRYRRRHRDGSWRFVDGYFTNLLDEPSVRGVVCNAHDVTELVAALEGLEFESFHDPLTGLSNRRVLFESGPAALGRCARRGSRLAIAVIDLDGFRALNDLHGFEVGDEVLWRVADVLRFTSRVGDLVTRAGGDDFVMISEDIDEPGGLAALAGRIAEAVGAITVADERVRVSVSIGGCLVPGNITIDDALARADEMLTAAKRRGGGIEIAVQ